MVDLSRFIDNSLKAEFEAKPYDVSKDRAKLIKRFQAALTQFKAGQVKAPNKLWKLSNGVVEFKVPFGADVLVISGAKVNYIPEGQFPGFIEVLIEATGTGEFDGALKAAQVAPSKATSASSGSRNLSAQSRLNIRVGGFRRGGMDDTAITAKLKAEGVSDSAIKAALDRKKG